jgi:hypothetical protein
LGDDLLIVSRRGIASEYRVVGRDGLSGCVTLPRQMVDTELSRFGGFVRSHLDTSISFRMVYLGMCWIVGSVYLDTICTDIADAGGVGGQWEVFVITTSPAPEHVSRVCSGE